MTGSTAWAALADASWLTGERVRRIGLVLAALTIFFLTWDAWVHTRAGITSAGGEYLGQDFVNYWSGAQLAAQGHALQVYNLDGFMAWQRAHAAANADVKWYSYPPTALLLSLPLAFFGFKAALLFWLMTGWGLCALLLRRLMSWRSATLMALGAPASFVNAVSGQNGEFSATLLCGGLLMLERNPVAAGCLFGLLGFKPQLAVLVPFALAAGGYWRAFMAAAVTAVATVLVSVLAFGEHTWLAFLHNAPLNTKLMEAGDGFWHRMPTVFAFVRLLGGSIVSAYGAQIMSAAIACLIVIRAWRGDATIGRKAAMLVLATFVTTPYAWDYDLVSLSFAVTWLALDGLKTGFRSWEKSLLALTIVTPLILSPFAAFTHVQIGPLVLWAMLLFTLRLPGGAADRSFSG